MEPYRSLVLGIATILGLIALGLDRRVHVPLQHLTSGDHRPGSNAAAAGYGRMRSANQHALRSKETRARVRQSVSWRRCIVVAAVFIPALIQLSVTPAAAVSAEPTLARGVSRTPRPGAVAASSSQEILAVMYKAGRLSVHAERMPLGRILEEVARQTGLDVRGGASLQQDVSVQFAGLPLFDGLRRLLARVNYLLLIERSPEGNIQRMQALVFRREASPSFGRFAREAPTPSTEGIASEAPWQAMADADPSVRRWAVERLGEQGDAQAFTRLLAALDDADPGVRQGALASLSQYGAMALEPLQAFLRREQDHIVRVVALQMLGQVGSVDEATVMLLQEMLTDHHPYIRAAVVEALGSVGGPRATDALHTAARDGDPEVRLSALRALALHVHDALAQAAVEQHLDDADEAVRGGAAALLETFTE
jgi:hypothetical protein